MPGPSTKTYCGTSGRNPYILIFPRGWHHGLAMLNAPSSPPKQTQPPSVCLFINPKNHPSTEKTGRKTDSWGPLDPPTLESRERGTGISRLVSWASSSEENWGANGFDKCTSARPACELNHRQPFLEKSKNILTNSDCGSQLPSHTLCQAHMYSLLQSSQWIFEISIILSI